jgi:regulator of protease activity HflC (stomatin/prohibitin superfamily)
MNVADVMRALTTVAWLAALAVIVIVVARAGRGKPVKGATAAVLGLIAVAVLLTVVSAGLVFVQPEERGVVISALDPHGYKTEALQPGLRWVVPFFENVVTYPISRQTYTMSIAPLEGAVQGDDAVTARTADGQELFIDASIIFAIDPEKVVDVHIDWKNRYRRAVHRRRGIIIPPPACSVGRSSSKRDDFQAKMEPLWQRSYENGLVMIDFILRNIVLANTPPRWSRSRSLSSRRQAALVVEQRKQTEQAGRRPGPATPQSSPRRAAPNLLEADAEAKALELIAAALAGNPDLITCNYVLKLAPGIQVMLVPNDNRSCSRCT